MKAPKISIRWKLLAGFVGLTLLVLLVVLFTVSQILENRIRSDINDNFREAGMIFKQLQEVRFRQLRQTARLVADMPYMKAAISTGDPRTVNNQIRQEIADLLHFDPVKEDTSGVDPLTTSLDSIGLMMVFDAQGHLLGELSPAASSTGNGALRPGVQRALQGQYPKDSYIWKKGNSYFKVVTIPVFIEERIAGALALGYPIRNREAELLANVIEYEVTYYVDKTLLATSFPSLTDAMRTKLQTVIKNASPASKKGSRTSTVTFNMQNERWLLYLLPMGGHQSVKNEITGYYAVAKSLTQALAPLRQLQRVIYIIGLGVIIIAVVLGITLTNHLTKPIKLLLKGIRRIENQEYDKPVKVVSRDEFGQLTRTFNELVAHIKENLREKEVLMAEIHHRVKNNLAVISGLLELEADKAEDEKAGNMLQNSRMRIHSMAKIHELMYEAQNFHQISFNHYIEQMLESIKEVYGTEENGISFELDLDEVYLNMNQAVPTGLIINELVTNALKHAYPSDQSGVIEIAMKEKGTQIELSVRDEGVGLPDNWRENSGSLGFTLIRILSKQLEGDLSIRNGEGTEVVVTFERDMSDDSGSWARLS